MPKTALKPTGTDWKRVQCEAAADAPIPHATSDGPYDPNDSAAVAAYWQQTTITRGRGSETLYACVCALMPTCWVHSIQPGLAGKPASMPWP